MPIVLLLQARAARWLWRAAVIVAAVVVVALWGMTHAGAQTAVDGDPVTPATTVITLSPLLVSFLTGTVTPLVAGLATKAWASTTVKAVVGIITAIVGAVVAWLIDHSGGFALSDFLMYVAFVFVAHVATYYGAWKPLTPGPGAFTMTLTPKLGVGGPNPNA